MCAGNLRRMRKQPVGGRNDWNHNLEEGDRVYTWVSDETVVMDDLVVSRGKNKRASGELTPVRVCSNGKARIAIRKDGVWYWRPAAAKE